MPSSLLNINVFFLEADMSSLKDDVSFLNTKLSMIDEKVSDLQGSIAIVLRSLANMYVLTFPLQISKTHISIAF